MSRNASGTYTIPVSAFVPGSVIKSADVNTDLSDIATALTQSLATTGVSSMTGQLKNADGTSLLPAMTFASDSTKGLYSSGSNVITMVIAASATLLFNTTGITLQGTSTITDIAGNTIGAFPIGSMVDYGGSSAPSLWQLCSGLAISRTTFAKLFAVIGTTFGIGDGSTTFNLPDLRGRSPFGRDDMGGVAANRVTTAGSGINGIALAASGGAETVTLTQANLTNATLTFTTSAAGAHSHTPSSGGNFITDAGGAGTAGNGGAPLFNVGSSAATTTSANHTHTGTTTSINGNVTQTAVNKMTPAIIVNKIIYAGV